MHRKQFQVSIPWPESVSLSRVIDTIRPWLPNRGNVLFTFIIIGSLVWAGRVGALPLGAPLTAAVSTSSIPYQGRLADGAGTPLTGTYNIIFRLYSAVAGGTPLWEEQWTGSSSVQVSDGLFNVMLGSLTPIPQNVLSGNSNLFLGITVGTDSEMVPRVQLGTVPYAVQALTVPDGSITEAKLADDISLEPPDNSITSDKLALQRGSVCLPPPETVVSAPDNYQRVPVPGMTLSITMNETGHVLVWATGVYHFNAEAYMGNSIFLNNDEVFNSSTLGRPSWDNFSLIRHISVPAGTHSLKLYTFAQQPGQISFAGGTLKETCLEYIVLP